MIKEVDPIELVKNAAGMGFTQDQISKLLNCTSRTLRNKFHENEDLKKAYEEGRESIKYEVTQHLMDKIRSGDTACILFYLKCQCGWRETKTFEISKPTIYLPQEDD